MLAVAGTKLLFLVEENTIHFINERNYLQLISKIILSYITILSLVKNVIIMHKTFLGLFTYYIRCIEIY